MNKTEAMFKRNDTLREYETQGGQVPKRNHLRVDSGNTFEHEVGKLRIAYDLRKMGHEFISEAVEKDTKLRRDIVDLDDGHVYEIETDPKRAERHRGDPNVTVIMVK